MSDRETASYVVGHVHAATWLSNHNSMLRSLCTESTGERRLWVTGQRHGTGMCAAFSPLVSALGVASSSQFADESLHWMAPALPVLSIAHSGQRGFAASHHRLCTVVASQVAEPRSTGSGQVAKFLWVVGNRQSCSYAAESDSERERER